MSGCLHVPLHMCVISACSTDSCLHSLPNELSDLVLHTESSTRLPSGLRKSPRGRRAAAAAAEETRSSAAAEAASAHAREAAALAAAAEAAAAGAAEARAFGRGTGAALAELDGDVADFAAARFQRDPRSGEQPTGPAHAVPFSYGRLQFGLLCNGPCVASEVLTTCSAVRPAEAASACHVLGHLGLPVKQRAQLCTACCSACTGAPNAAARCRAASPERRGARAQARARSCARRRCRRPATRPACARRRPTRSWPTSGGSAAARRTRRWRRRPRSLKVTSVLCGMCGTCETGCLIAYCPDCAVTLLSEQRGLGAGDAFCGAERWSVGCCVAIAAPGPCRGGLGGRGSAAQGPGVCQTRRRSLVRAGADAQMELDGEQGDCGARAGGGDGAENANPNRPPAQAPAPEAKPSRIPLQPAGRAGAGGRGGSRGCSPVRQR